MRVSALMLLCLSFLPLITIANGGDQRVVEGKYLVNLSRSPFTPRVGVPTKMLVSFVDLKSNFPIQEDLIVDVRITKQGGPTLFDKNGLRAERGVLEFSYTFTQSDLHEVFFNFALASSPQKVYEAPDFLLDVQESKTSLSSPAWLSPKVLIAAAVFMIAGYLLGVRGSRRLI